MLIDGSITCFATRLLTPANDSRINMAEFQTKRIPSQPFPRASVNNLALWKALSGSVESQMNNEWSTNNATNATDNVTINTINKPVQGVNNPPTTS